MNGLFKKLLKNQQGQVLILFVFMFIILSGFLGLVIDIWQITYTRQKLQDGVDLSALAAAQQTIENSGLVESTAKNLGKKNGILSDEMIVNNPYNGDSLKVEVIATKTVKLIFLPILGYNQKTISVRAVAGAKNEPITGYKYEAFQYAVFNGGSSNPLNIKGNGSIITGNVHSNEGISVSGNKHQINGDVSAVSSISLGNTYVSGTVTESSPYVPTPAFDFNKFASNADNIINTDLKLSGDITIEGIWLVKGNCSISGLRVSGKGILLVTGELQIAGGLEYNTMPVMYKSIDDEEIGYITEGDLLALYSLNNIRISGVNSNIHGALYAPNGEIRIDGSGNTFNGALIADSVVWATADTTINGSYDLRVPKAFTVDNIVYGLVE